MSHVHPSTRWKNMTWLSVSWKYSASVKEPQKIQCSMQIKCAQALSLLLPLYIYYIITDILTSLLTDIFTCLFKKRKKKGQTYLFSSTVFLFFIYFLHFEACQGNAILHSVGYRDAKNSFLYKTSLCTAKSGRRKIAIQCKRITKINENPTDWKICTYKIRDWKLTHW